MSNIYIKFDVAVRDHFRSTNKAILFRRLYDWCVKYPEGFYKFKLPCCRHPLYRKGDSWGEELGMSRKVLDSIFPTLVRHYATKGLYDQSEDKFGGKLFASYTNRKTHQTFYFMNHEAVEDFLGFIQKKKKAGTRPPAPIRSVIHQTGQAQKNLPVSPSTNVPLEPPLTCAYTKSNLLQTNTTLSRDVPLASEGVLGEEVELSSKKMIDLWNSHMPSKVVWYPSTAMRLVKVLADFFNGCLETFERYCKALSDSSFLTGKAPNSKFKALFYWAIKPEVIKSIFQGAYGVKDILATVMKKPGQASLAKEYEDISHQLKDIETTITKSKDEIIKAQDKSIKEYRETLSDEVKDGILSQAEAHVESLYPDGNLDVGLRKMLVNTTCHGFLNDYCREKLGFSKAEDIVTPQNLLDRKKHLEAKRVEISRQMEQIERQKNQKLQAVMESFG